MNSTVKSPKFSQVKSAKLELERLQSQVNVLKQQLATQRQALNQVEAGSDRVITIASQLSEIHAAINSLQPSIQQAMDASISETNQERERLAEEKRLAREAKLAEEKQFLDELTQKFNEASDALAAQMQRLDLLPRHLANQIQRRPGVAIGVNQISDLPYIQHRVLGQRRDCF